MEELTKEEKRKEEIRFNKELRIKRKKDSLQLLVNQYSDIEKAIEQSRLKQPQNTSFRINPDLRDRLKRQATLRSLTMTDLITVFVDFLERLESVE